MDATQRPLNGIRVIEFTHMVMGPSIGLILADLGADVIKVEPLKGDNTRRLLGSGAGYFPMYNRNKRSLCVDTTTPAGKAVVNCLLAQADVFIENFRPGAMAENGWDFATLSQSNPRIICCSAKGFLSGPYEQRTALDEVAQMMGGLAYMTGLPGKPMRAGASVIDVTGGMFGVIGILAALEQRHRTGLGQQVTASLYEATAFMVGQHMAQGVVTGKPAPPMTQRLSAWGVYDIFDTADKDQVFIAVVSDTQWRKFCEAFGFAELSADRSLDANSGRVQQRERTMPYLREQFGRWSKADLMAKLETIGLPFAPVARPEDLFDDPHLNAAGGLIDLTLPDGQPIKLPALPLEMHGERFDAYRDLPHVGQHSREALLEAGFSAAEIAELSQSGVIRLPEARVMAGRTLLDKLWQQHLVADLGDGASLLHIDRVFLHERTGSVALQTLQADGRRVRQPELAFCTMDHIVDTLSGRNDDTRMPGGKAFIQTTRETTRAAGIRLFDVNDPQQGIVHVISPELGIVLPGATVVCPDSHTCTQGALGALAWGIGSSEAEHALATQTLRLSRPGSMRVVFNGQLGKGVTAKDMILWLIGRHSASGAAGHALEFAGEAVRALPVEARLTLCNMAVEFSAFTGIIAPDDAVFEYLHGRPFAPQGAMWDAAVKTWRTLHSDEDAVFDRHIEVDASRIAPMLTWGTSPQHAVAVDGTVPDPLHEPDPHSRQAMERALQYMDLQPGQQLADVPIEAAFIGSCTNARLSDLRAAAAVLRGRKVAPGVRAICVPGSTQVKREAEAEGLHHIFTEAGFEWRESGCSMCFFAGGESFGHRQRVVSTTNRNFEGRQGPETRSHLASPITVAASAIAGRLADPRPLLDSMHG